MKTNLENYEIFPKILPAGVKKTVKVYPRGRHARLDADTTFIVTVRPLTGWSSNRVDKIRDFIVAETKPDADGGITFTHAFSGEQEHYVRLYRAPLSDTEKNVKLYQFSVYSLYPDLYARRPLRGDFHVHTRESDGREAPEIVCASYRKAGFDFLAITDHHRYYPSLDAIKFYENIPTGLSIYPGEEVHSPDNHVHIVNFGGNCSVNEQFANDPDTYRREVEAIAAALPELEEGVDPFVYAACKWCYDKIRAANGLAIYAHPHWVNDTYNVSDAMTRRQFKDGLFDAFEVLGGHEARCNNMQTAMYQQMRAEGCERPIVGSSDSHGTYNASYFKWFSTFVFAESTACDAVIRAVKDKYSVACEQEKNEQPRVFGPYRMVMYALFLMEEYFPYHDELCFEEGRLMKEAALGDASAVDLLARIHTHADAYWDRCING